MGEPLARILSSQVAELGLKGRSAQSIETRIKTEWIIVKLFIEQTRSWHIIGTIDWLTERGHESTIYYRVNGNFG